MRSRVDTSGLIGSVFKNQLLLNCGSEWSAVDPIIIRGGASRGNNPFMVYNVLGVRDGTILMLASYFYRYG